MEPRCEAKPEKKPEIRAMKNPRNLHRVQTP